MGEKKIFIRENKPEENGADCMEQMIRVVPRRYSLALAGGLIIAAAILCWVFLGEITITSSATGLYHPGAASYGEILCFMPISAGKKIDPGMRASVSLSGYDQQQYGHMDAEVTWVDPYVSSVSEMQSLLGDDLMTSMFTQRGPVVLVVLKLEEDESSENGYFWNNERGKSVNVKDGTWASVSIVTSVQQPLKVFYPEF